MPIIYYRYRYTRVPPGPPLAPKLSVDGQRIYIYMYVFFIINHLFIITRRSAGPPDTRLRNDAHV